MPEFLPKLVSRENQKKRLDLQKFYNPEDLYETIPPGYYSVAMLSKEDWLEKEIMPLTMIESRLDEALKAMISDIIWMHIDTISKIAMAEYVLRYSNDPIALKREESELLLAFKPSDGSAKQDLSLPLAKTLLSLGVAIEMNKGKMDDFAKKYLEDPKVDIYGKDYFYEGKTVVLPNGQERIIDKTPYIITLAECRVWLAYVASSPTSTTQDLALELAKTITEKKKKLEEARNMFDVYDVGIFAKILTQELGLESKIRFEGEEVILSIRDPHIKEEDKGWYMMKFR